MLKTSVTAPAFLSTKPASIRNARARSSAGSVVLSATVLSAFTDLKIPAEVRDSGAGRVESNVFYRRGDLAGRQISTYLSCGEGITGPYADNYRVYMVAMVTVAPRRAA